MPAAPLGVGDAVVTLLAADGTPLKEKTIVFLVTSGATTTAVAEITDGAGQARISQPVPEAADYTVEAYFGQTAALPGGRSVTLLDPLYGPSSATGSIVLPSGVALVLTNEQTKIVYNDSKAAGASNGNRGHGLTRIDAGISFDDPAFVRTSILSSPTSSTVTARIRALLSGAILFEGNITLAVTGPGSSRWSGQASINGTTAQLTVAWISSAYTGNTGDIDVTITTPKGHGPLYNDLAAILDFDLSSEPAQARRRSPVRWSSAVPISPGKRKTTTSGSGRTEAGMAPVPLEQVRKASFNDRGWG